MSLDSRSRLAALQQLELLDTPAEEVFDRLASLASNVLHVPVVLMSLVDEQRQFFKSCIGLPEPWASQRQTPLSHSFCQHVIVSGEPLIIPNARDHPLVKDNLAIPDLGVVAYAGIPLTTANTHVIGTFAVIDQEQRSWTDEEIEILKDLARAVMTEINLRGEIVARKQAQERLRLQLDFSTAITTHLGEGVYALDDAGRLTFMNPVAETMLGWTAAELLGKHMHEVVHFQRADGSRISVEACPLVGVLRSATPYHTDDDVFTRKDGSVLPVAYTAAPIVSDGQVKGMVVAFRDITERKQQEEAIRWQAHLLASVEQAVIAVDLAGNITYWNHYAETLYGWPAAEAIGQPATIILPAEPEVTTAHVAEIMARLRAGESWSGTFRVRHRDGTIFPVHVTDSPVRDGNGTLVGIVGVSHDITARLRLEEALRQAKDDLERRIAERTTELTKANTQLHRELAERKRVEEALQESQRVLSTLLSNLPGMAYQCRNDHDWTIEFVSDGCFALTGYHAAEMIGNGSVRYSQLIHPDDRATVWDEVQRAVQARRPFQLVYRITTATGEEKWVWEQGRAVAGPEGDMLALEGFVTDITERKRATEQQALLAAVVESTDDAIISTTLNGSIISWNPGAENLYGYTTDEVKGQPIALLVPPSHAHEVPAALESIRHGEKINQYTTVRVGKDGRAIDVSMTLAPVRDAAGRITALSEIHRDVTERVQAYALLEQRVAARTHELATLLDVAHNVASTLELQPLLGIILEQLKAVVDYSHAVISTHPGTDISILDDRGTLPRDAALQMHFSVTGTLAAENDQQLLIIDDVGGDTSWARTIRMIAGETRQRQGDVVRSFLSVPLRAKERLLGRLSLTHHEPNYFTPQRAALAKAVADHAAVAIEHATLYARAQELAVVEERQRLARELHDSVTQSLYSLTLFAEAAHLLAANGEWESVAGYLVRLGETAQQALAEMRLLLYELRPSALEQAGLVGALQRRLDAVEKRAGINAQLLVEGVIDLPAAVIDALYRILEEALNNTLKHAGATTVQVRIRAAAHEVEAEVVDDGKGFTLQVLPDTGGLGLTSMQERAEQLGGALALASAPGAGTRIHVVLPLPDR